MPDLDSREDYRALVRHLADEARAGGVAESAAAREDAVWDAVGDVVPGLTAEVCESVLAHADREPDAGLVDEVTSARDSGDDERLRARAVTVLVADVRSALAGDQSS